MKDVTPATAAGWHRRGLIRAIVQTLMAAFLVGYLWKLASIGFSRVRLRGRAGPSPAPSTVTALGAVRYVLASRQWFGTTPASLVGLFGFGLLLAPLLHESALAYAVAAFLFVGLPVLTLVATAARCERLAHAGLLDLTHRVRAPARAASPRASAMGGGAARPSGLADLEPSTTMLGMAAAGLGIGIAANNDSGTPNADPAFNIDGTPMVEGTGMDCNGHPFGVTNTNSHQGSGWDFGEYSSWDSGGHSSWDSSSHSSSWDSGSSSIGGSGF